MSETLQQIRALIQAGKVRASHHGYTELRKDGLFYDELVTGVMRAQIVEDYPEYAKGPCVLVLQRNPDGSPAHVLWGIRSGSSEPAVLITAYRPDPTKWDPSLLRRKR